MEMVLKWSIATTKIVLEMFFSVCKVGSQTRLSINLQFKDPSEAKLLKFESHLMMLGEARHSLRKRPLNRRSVWFFDYLDNFTRGSSCLSVVD